MTICLSHDAWRPKTLFIILRLTIHSRCFPSGLSFSLINSFSYCLINTIGRPISRLCSGLRPSCVIPCLVFNTIICENRKQTNKNLISCCEFPFDLDRWICNESAAWSDGPVRGGVPLVVIDPHLREKASTGQACHCIEVSAPRTAPCLGNWTSLNSSALSFSSDSRLLFTAEVAVL